MEALALIVQRLFYGFFFGCIVILFFVLNFYVLSVAGLLPYQLETIVGNYASGNMSVLIFVIMVVLTGTMFEGLFEVCCEYYFRRRNAEKVFNKHGKRKFLPLLIWHIFRKIGVVEACLSYENKKEPDPAKSHMENPIFAFMDDTKNYQASEALWECEKYIEYKHKGSGVTRYKELAFILQLVGFSFLCNSILSFLVGIIVFVLWSVTANGAMIPVLFFYASCFAVSMLLYRMAVSMAVDFGKRYIRDVGRWYNALKTADSAQAKGANP